MNPRIESLQKMLNGPRDGALLRFSLGNEFLKERAWQDAAEAFRAAVERDPHYSAAWKGLGKALTEAGERAAALAAYTQGQAAAEQRGDIQASKEMGVFIRRLQKAGEAAGESTVQP